MDFTQLFESIDLQQIEEFIANGQEEHLTLDFKTINRADLSHKDDRKTFAKALSGFANSSGGLIIWGVEANNKNPEGVDKACGKKEISNLQQFLSKLNEFTGSFVSPLVDGVVHRGVEEGNDTGFALTLIPASSSGPHMAKAGEDRYYKRSGDSFYRMEHFDLEDMFGRRPKPKLIPVVRGSFPRIPYGRDIYGWKITFDIVNEGRGMAKFVCLRFKPIPNIKPQSIGRLWIYAGEPDASTGGTVFSFELSPEKVIHPGRVIPFDSGLILEQSLIAESQLLNLDCTIYCEGGAPNHTTIRGVLE